MAQIHGTCVTWRGGGVLFTGPSGVGKSDLALRMIHGGGVLVADDRVILHRDGNELIGRPPAATAGLMEVRGLGILKLPFAKQGRIDVIIELIAHRGGIDRLPEPRTRSEQGVTLPCWRLYAHETSAVAKVDLALSLARGEAELQW